MMAENDSLLELEWKQSGNYLGEMSESFGEN